MATVTETPAVTPAPAVGKTKKPRRPLTAREIGENIIAGLRLIPLAIIVLVLILTTHASQWAGLILKPINKRWYDRYQTYFKGVFGILLTTITQVWCPTNVQISFDKSLAGAFKLVNGKLVTALPERAIFIANHQIYTDWLYIWWIAFVNQCHQAIFIVLKATLRKIWVIGKGMEFYNFIFVERNKSGNDLKVLKDGLNAFNSIKGAMWMLIFPEGTNATPGARARSAARAEKRGQSDYEEILFPLSTGLYTSVQGLKSSVDSIISLTMGYKGVHKGHFAAQKFTFWSVIGKGQSPEVVSLHFSSIPTKGLPEDANEFDQWLLQHWRAKDELMVNFAADQALPPSEEDGVEYINTSIGLNSPLDALHLLVPVVVTAATIMVPVYGVSSLMSLVL